MNIVNMPAKFPGTEAEIAANRETHHFDPYVARCYDCDCRPWGRVAEWPCGTEPPRVDVRYEGPVANLIVDADPHGRLNQQLVELANELAGEEEEDERDDPYNLDPADMGPPVGSPEYAAMIASDPDYYLGKPADIEEVEMSYDEAKDAIDNRIDIGPLPFPKDQEVYPPIGDDYDAWVAKPEDGDEKHVGKPDEPS